MNTEQERAEFEAWIASPPYEKPLGINPEASGFPGQYSAYEVQLAWEAYQAGRAAQTPSAPEGWVMVPVQPTEVMKAAGCRALGALYGHYGAEQCWKAMLDAAPSPEGQEAEVEALRADAARWRYIRRKLCLTGNGDGTCAMQAINLPANIQGWPEPGQVAEFCDAAIDAAIAKGESHD